MNLIFTEEQLPEESFAEQMNRAADLAVTGEGLDPALCSASITFVSPEEIRALNAEYRSKDAVTDVLSFPQYEDLQKDYQQFLAFRAALELGDREAACFPEEEFCLGDVVICKERAREQALEFGHSVEREVVYLMVHSLFHLMGYDHEEEGDKIEMRAKEEAVMNALGIVRPQ